MANLNLFYCFVFLSSFCTLIRGEMIISSLSFNVSHVKQITTDCTQDLIKGLRDGLFPSGTETLYIRNCTHELGGFIEAMLANIENLESESEFMGVLIIIKDYLPVILQCAYEHCGLRLLIDNIVEYLQTQAAFDKIWNGFWLHLKNIFQDLVQIIMQKWFNGETWQLEQAWYDRGKSIGDIINKVLAIGDWDEFIYH